MRWIAPTEKDTANEVLEKRLWDAADQIRANSGLKAGQYWTPVLGLIFLRFAEARFAQRRSQLEKTDASARRDTSRIDDPRAYHAEGVLYLMPSARFDYLLQRPEGSNVGRAVNVAMADIERHIPQLAGVLPRNYQIFNGTLLRELLKKVSEIPVSLDYDAFGRIYEYFLGQFARTEGQKGGEFHTPAPIVRLTVEILEPFHGRILDPACGSGGMFVQSARFVAEHKKNPSSELSIFGVEKTDDTGCLCRMNLAVHGLEGDIRHGGEINSYCDDPNKAVGAFDFLLANPPFNVNAVDEDRLKDAVGAGRRLRLVCRVPTTPTTCGSSSSIPRSTTKAAPPSSWPIPRATRARRKWNCASNSSRPVRWTPWSPSARTCSTPSRCPARCGSSTAARPNFPLAPRAGRGPG